MKAYLATMTLLLVLAAVPLHQILVYLSLPTVHKSWSTGECIEVKSLSGEYSCENMPSKYHVVWVQ